MDRTVPKGAALLLDFIRETEVGRSDRASYDVIFGNRQDRLPTPLTRMTLDEVLAAQRGWSKRNGSSAAGGYQFMRATLQGLKQELALRGTQILDPDLQDRLGYHLLIRRGYHAFINGALSRVEFARRLAMEWASFPVLERSKGQSRMVERGQSYYAGDGLNKALVKPEAVEAVLGRVLAAAKEERPVVEKPVVQDPEELDKPLTKSKTVWTWLLTAIGAPLAAFADLDWRVQLVIVALIAGFAAYAIKRRHDIAEVYRDLKAELGQG